MKGEFICSNISFEGCYSRCIDLNDLKPELADAGLEVEESLEPTVLAIYKDEDPVGIRIIAVRKK